MGVKLLSKSKIVEGISCEKKVYLSVHKPELKSPVSPQQQKIFDQGTEVGIRARSEFPGGHEVLADYWNIAAGLKETQDAIQCGNNTIYEAVFSDGSLHCRVDILTRTNSNEPWTMIEVKSGTSPKEEYILDAAIQSCILRSAGINFSRVMLMHINSECVFPDLSNLFELVDVTADVSRLETDIKKSIAKIRSVLLRKDIPKIGIGRHCDSPYSCDYKDRCWQDIPDPSVFDLPNSWKLFDNGFIGIEELSEDDLSKNQVIPLGVIRTGKRYVNHKGIKESLKKFVPPFYHLDFETIGPAIPRFPGTRPYMNVPVQFSLHVQLEEFGVPEHFEYLHEDYSDPREMIAKNLVKWIPAVGGTVVAYNASFEKNVIKNLSEQFPKYREHLLSIIERLVDPLPVVRSNVYDKGFRGSFSIKAVAPSLLGPDWDYSKLDVSDGKLAQIAFDEMVNPKISQSEKEQIRKKLLQYCAQDTAAIVELLNWLFSNREE